MAIFSGDIFAENYTVSSSVTNVQISSVSGSTKSGDSGDDIHQFTGSLHISASRITLTDGVGDNIGNCNYNTTGAKPEPEPNVDDDDDFGEFEG